MTRTMRGPAPRVCALLLAAALLAASVPRAAANNDPTCPASPYSFSVLVCPLGTAVRMNIYPAGTLLVGAIDPDGDALTVDTTLVAPPERGVLELSGDGSFSYAAEYKPGGLSNMSNVAFSFRLLDGKGGSVVCDAQIQIGPGDGKPVVFGAPWYKTAWNTAFSTTPANQLLAYTCDADSPALTYTLVPDPSPGPTAGKVGPSSGSFTTFDPATGAFTYVPDPLAGPETNIYITFYYSVSDGTTTLGPLRAMIEIGYNGLNTVFVPIIYEALKTEPRLVPASVGLLSPFTDGVPRGLAQLNWPVVWPGAKMEANLNDGSFRFTPPTDPPSTPNVVEVMFGFLAYNKEPSTAPPPPTRVIAYFMFVDALSTTVPMPPVNFTSFEAGPVANVSSTPSDDTARLGARRAGPQARRKAGRKYDASMIEGVLRLLSNQIINGAEAGVPIMISAPPGTGVAKKPCIIAFTKASSSGPSGASTRGVGCKACDKCLKKYPKGTTLQAVARANRKPGKTEDGRTYVDGPWSDKPVTFTT